MESIKIKSTNAFGTEREERLRLNIYLRYVKFA